MEDNRKIYMLYNLKGTPFVHWGAGAGIFGNFGGT